MTDAWGTSEGAPANSDDEAGADSDPYTNDSESGLRVSETPETSEPTLESLRWQVQILQQLAVILVKGKIE